jgi:hypothetical protein
MSRPDAILIAGPTASGKAAFVKCGYVKTSSNVSVYHRSIHDELAVGG